MKKQKKSIFGNIFYGIIVILLIAIICQLAIKFEQNNFNDFTKMEYIPYSSSFTRDSEIKYARENSYKIESITANDAMFYQTIEVEPNTPYRVSCMVKTENIVPEKEVSIAGANICITNTVEKSKSITGTNDWQRLEFLFNSKNRTSVDIGFRLGSYSDNCTGTAWFSNFLVEKGTIDTSNHWNFVCFIFENTEVTVQTNGQNKTVKLSMNSTDISDMKQNMSRFKTSIEELSAGNMSVNYDIITVKTPITNLSYDTENGYYVAPENIGKIIDPYLKGKNYDHLFVAVRLGDVLHPSDIEVQDWIGLGGMDYLGIGFSNIRLPNSEKSYIYKYDARINTFPEEVFIHEFLHTLERNAKEYGYERPELHSYAQYGYEDQKLIGLKNWYQDYMRRNISYQGTKIGLPPEVYKMKPIKESDFTYCVTLDVMKEPRNIIEKIKNIIQKIKQDKDKGEIESESIGL